MAFGTTRPLMSRARHVIAFVAITWSVAATFVVFEVVSLRAVDLALSYPALFGDRMLSRIVAESTSCTVADGSASQAPPAMSEADARLGPWLLGLSLGRDAVFRMYSPGNRQVPEEMTRGRDDLAERLSVRSPGFFAPERFTDATSEFVAFVEQGGAAETARQLAGTHSPRACELFKLGAVWGYTEMVRIVLPGARAVFGLEIRHYARRADVPERLWNPLLQVTAADATGADIAASTEAITDGVTSFLAGGR